jgi:L-threonylcarbamoyladenylate synthase
MTLPSVPIDPLSPQSAVLDRAAEALRRGDLVVAPTETRYGLLVRADQQSLLEHLYRVKQRDLDQATAVLVRGLGEIEALGVMTPAARRLASRFLPGPLTLVLAGRPDWPPPRVVGGKIGIRWSSSPVIAGLLKRLDCPLTATSANISGRPDPESVEEIASQLGNRVSMYLDAGPLSGATSTVVDCSAEPARILRDGAIGRSEIETVLEPES